jgi:thioredoxin-like negative regulator of GroEL
MKRLLLLIGLVLLPAVCEAQGVTSPYLQLVWRYRAGDTRGAVAAGAALPTRGLRERVLRDLGSHICNTIAGERDCETVRERQREIWRSRVVPLLRVAMPAAVLLHLHVATILEVAGAREEGLAHRRLVSILLDRMTPLESDLEPADAAAFRDIRRRAHHLVTWLLQSDLAVNEADEAIRDGLRAFPDDADLLLACGWVEETWARQPYLDQRYAQRSSQMTVAAGGRSAWLNRERTFRLARAADCYRRSLAANPAQTEARVRLGRVLSLQNHPTEARAAFTAIGADAEPRYRYLAALFAAGMDDRAGNRAAAKRSYEAALRIWPGNQAARIALGRLLLGDGDRAGAAALIAALSTTSADLEPDADPWIWYHLGQAWRLEAAFVALRVDIHR